MNRAEIQYIKDVMHPYLMDLVCCSHSLNNVGQKFDAPELDVMFPQWISFFAHDPTSRLAWFEIMGESMKVKLEQHGDKLMENACPTPQTL